MSEEKVNFSTSLVIIVVKPSYVDSFMLSFVLALVDTLTMYSVDRYYSLVYERVLAWRAEAKEVVMVGIFTVPLGCLSYFAMRISLTCLSKPMVNFLLVHKYLSL